jgi:hypothetical protein
LKEEAMKRKVLLALALVMNGLWLLSACAPRATSGGPTPTATDRPHGTPDVRMATPQFGSAQRPRSQGPEPLLLYSLPDPNSAISGEIFPGDQGQVLGMDDSQLWVLVQFGDTTGWTPVNTLALTISQ